MARKPKLDTVLADAVDTARAALTEIASASEVGDYQGVAVEGERLVTHRFIAHRDGYRGWNWFVTLARVPRAKAKDATVCEIGIIPGEEALLAPAWVHGPIAWPRRKWRPPRLRRAKKPKALTLLTVKLPRIPNTRNVQRTTRGRTALRPGKCPALRRSPPMTSPQLRNRKPHRNGAGAQSAGDVPHSEPRHVAALPSAIGRAVRPNPG
ncbi:DUF3027 domain-containing protein [Arthrobacter sp. JCM 19049]|uniref:DUF3027 domain-containing protein n=1 Tax=Arthrobacter sp. JCM 19049 TaxID=1460643 RepID=UPI0006D279EE|nr:DUF3027 domain-containing protein [Arthrobacter sp. JCM 19049]